MSLSLLHLSLNATGLTDILHINESDDTECFIEILINDFSDSLGKENIPLESDKEYMRIIELKFLLKNLRELIDIQLYQSYSKSSELTVNGNSSSTTAQSAPLISSDSISSSRGNSSSSSSSSSSSKTHCKEHKRADRKNLYRRKEMINEALKYLKSYIQIRLSLSKWIPRILQLCNKYQLNESESDIFHLMVTVQGSDNAHCLNTLVEEDYLRRITGFQRICNMSEVGIEIFCDSERLHMKEGIILVDEEQGTHFNLRTSRTVVQLLYGRSVKFDDLLKIAQTSLEEILQNETAIATAGAAGTLHGIVDEKVGKSKRKSISRDSSSVLTVPADNEMVQEDANVAISPSFFRTLSSSDSNKKSRIGHSIDEGDDSNASIPPAPPSLTRTRSLTNKSTPRFKQSRNSHGTASIIGNGNGKDTMSKLNELLLPQSLKNLGTPMSSDNSDDDDVDGDGDIDAYDKDGIAIVMNAGNSGVSGGFAIGEDSEVKPYPESNQLEYLEECFQIIQLCIKGNAARIKDDMKKEGARTSHWDSDHKHGKRELQAKLKLHESRVVRRVGITRDASLPLPRLEIIAERLGLDSFEKKIILLLIGKTVSPVVKTLIDTLDGNSRAVDDAVTVGQALSILCEDFKNQIDKRQYFYRSSRLMKNGIISLLRSRWHQGSGDLCDNRIVLDRRVLDWAVGLDSEINELVEGSDLYEPKVNLSQVVLPTGHLDALLSQCRCYDAFRKYRVSAKLEDVLTYGNSLVIMLCGKSGTGKTMTVNAVSKELNKKVLLVDFGSLTGKRPEGSTDMDADLRGLFREAQMSNAVIFFDECESIFKSRNQGGDRMLNSLLTEIEKHEGIVFLATNRPYDIDEAIHRRITSVLEYRTPDHLMRRSIWENLLGVQSTADSSIPRLHTGINLSEDVDVASIAVKYELTGGFIKNAVIAALLSAISRDKDHPVINHHDLVQGCKLQMRGVLSQRSFESSKVIAMNSISDLALTPSLKDAADTIIRHERARGRVYGSWSNNNSSHINQQKACIVLLSGPAGSGKKTLMKALAFDLTRTIKMVHLAELMIENVADTVSSIQLLVNDARLADAIIVLDGFEHIMEDSSGNGGSKLQLLLSRLLGILHSFPGCVVLIANMDSPQNITLQRDFAAQLFSFLRFIIPCHEVRCKLWQHLLPPLAPLGADINFNELGRKFELTPGSIASAIARAAAEAAMRDNNSTSGCKINQKDLMLAGDAEVSKLRHGNFELISRLFN